MADEPSRVPAARPAHGDRRRRTDRRRRAEAAGAARAAAAEREPRRPARAADRGAVRRPERQLGRSRAAQPRLAAAEGSGSGERRTSRVSPRGRGLPAPGRAGRARSRATSSCWSQRAVRRSRPATRRRPHARCASAEALWHGRPLADLEFERLARIEAERLEELRLAAVEERIDAELALGRHLPLVAELEALGAEYPFRERFRAQLMLALYRCGRQADGLEVYRQTRNRLNDELGLEPGRRAAAARAGDPHAGPGADPRGRPAAAARRGRSATSARTRGSRRSSRPTPSSSSDASGSSRSSSHVCSTRRCSRSSARRGAASLRCCAPACCRRSDGSGCSCAPASEPQPTSSPPLERVCAPASSSCSRSTSSRSSSRRPSPTTSGGRSSTRSSTRPGIPERRAVVLLALRADFFGHLAPSRRAGRPRRARTTSCSGR